MVQNEGVAIHIDPSHRRSAVRRPLFLWCQTRVVRLKQAISIALRQSDGGGMEVTIEGRNEFDDTCRKEVRIDKSWESLFDGDICLSMRNTKKIMAALQNAVVNHEAETYALLRRFCPDCHTLRPVTDYTTRRIRAVCGTIEVRNPRWMLCRECHPGPIERHRS